VSNAARLYNTTLTNKHHLQHDEWKFGVKLTTNHVWDAFIIFALLEDCDKQKKILRVPHSGEQDNRFKEAMEARNRRIILLGQPDAVRHACNKCMRVFEIDGKYSMSNSSIFFCY
jgi:hypothetical protein